MWVGRDGDVWGQATRGCVCDTRHTHGDVWGQATRGCVCDTHNTHGDVWGQTAVPIRCEETLRKIHLSFRLAYLKDVVMARWARPRGAPALPSSLSPGHVTWPRVPCARDRGRDDRGACVTRDSEACVTRDSEAPHTAMGVTTLRRQYRALHRAPAARADSHAARAHAARAHAQSAAGTGPGPGSGTGEETERGVEAQARA